MITPRQVFEDTMRPAELLRVYRLLEHDAAQFDGEMIQSLRQIVRALPIKKSIVLPQATSRLVAQRWHHSVYNSRRMRALADVH